VASILVVDDSASSRALLVGLLPHGGHRVREASNGAEGLGLATNPVEPPPGRAKGAPIGSTRGRGWFGSLSQSR